jgi:hypothetical protein
VTRARKLTAATESRAEAQFRQFVMALPPGAIVEWSDMDWWAWVNFRDFTDDAQEDLTVICMSLSEKFELEGWLAFQRPGPCPGAPDYHPRGTPDYYFRTDKERSLGTDVSLCPVSHRASADITSA